MYTSNIYNLLQKISGTHKSIDLAVDGISMNPTLKCGDVVNIAKQKEYSIGEIVVFNYKNTALLIHRILMIEGNKYYCKGDNAFRLECIDYEDIIGKVLLINESKAVGWPQWKIVLSYNVNREFYNSGFNIQETKSTEIYKLYKNLVLSNEIVDFRLQIRQDISNLNLNNSNFFAFAGKQCMQYISWEILDLISRDTTYNDIISFLCLEHSVELHKSYDLLNTMLTKFVINNLILVSG